MLAWLLTAGPAVEAARAQSPIPPPAPDLSGRWRVEDSRAGSVPLPGDVVKIEAQRGKTGSWVARFPDGDCAGGTGTIPEYFSGTLKGNTLEGRIHLCPSPAYLDLCGAGGPYSVAFRAVMLDLGTFAGNYTTEGYATAGEGESCTRDGRYDSRQTVRLERMGCSLEVIEDKIQRNCSDQRQHRIHLRMQASRMEQRREEAFRRARERLISLETLTLGSGKVAVKWVVFRLAGDAAKAVLAKVYLVGGIAVLGTQALLASQDLEDARDASAAELEAWDQLIASTVACGDAWRELDACREEVREQILEDAERARERADFLDLREQAEERLEYIRGVGDVYEDAEGYRYRGADALRAAMRDLEARQESDAGTVRFVSAGAADAGLPRFAQAGSAESASPADLAETILGDALRETLGREPTPAEMARARVDLLQVSEADRRAAEFYPITRDLGRAAREFGAARSAVEQAEPGAGRPVAANGPPPVRVRRGRDR